MLFVNIFCKFRKLFVYFAFHFYLFTLQKYINIVKRAANIATTCFVLSHDMTDGHTKNEIARVEIKKYIN